MLSSLVPTFKGKGDPLNPNSYRGIESLEHSLNYMRRFWIGICVRW